MLRHERIDSIIINSRISEWFRLSQNRDNRIFTSNLRLLVKINQLKPFLSKEIDNNEGAHSSGDKDNVPKGVWQTI